MHGIGGKSMAIDSQWGNTVLLLPFKDDLLDALGHVTTASGGAALSSAVGNPFGAGNALYCDGVNDVVTATSAAFTLGTADCSIQFWFYPVTGGHGASYGRMFTIGADGTTGSLYIMSSTTYDPMRLRFEYYNGGFVQLITENTTTVSNGAWHFFQLDRVLGVWSCYVDGTLYSTQTTIFTFTQSLLSIGANTAGGAAFKGYFSDVRVTTSAYRTSHAIPSSRFPRPTIKGVVLNASADPVAKTIFVRDRSTQRFLGGENSDAATGLYEFRPLDFGEVQVTRLDELCDPMTYECVFDLNPAQAASGRTLGADNKNHSLTFSGSLVAHTDGFSWSLPTYGSYIQSTSTDYSLGTDDFDISLMFYPLTGGHVGGSGTSQQWGRILQIGVNATAGTLIIYSPSNLVPMQINAQFYDTAYRDLGTVYPGSPTYNAATITNATWNKLRLRRVNGVFTMEVNGTTWLTSGTTAYNLTGTVLSIGTNTTGSESFYGNIGPVRISKGPRRAAASISNALLLTGPTDGGSGENAIIYDRVIPG